MSELYRELAVLIGTPTTVVAVLVFLGRRLIESTSQRELEKLRSDLDLKKIQHESKLVAIREKRAEIIAEFYERIVRAQIETTRLVSLFQTSQETEADKAGRRKHAYQICQQALNYFRLRRLFFDPTSCKLIDGILETIREAHIDFENAQNSEGRFRDELWIKVDKKMREELPLALEQLSESFRKAIGA